MYLFHCYDFIITQIILYYWVFVSEMPAHQMLHKGFISYIVELDLQTQLKKNNLLKSNKFIANHFNEKNRLSSIIKL